MPSKKTGIIIILLYPGLAIEMSKQTNAPPNFAIGEAVHPCPVGARSHLSYQTRQRDHWGCIDNANLKEQIKAIGKHE